MEGLSKKLTGLIDRCYIKPVRRIMPLQTFRYAAVGALNMAFGWLLYPLIFHFVIRKHDMDLGLFVLSGPVVTQVLVFVIITITGFMLNRSIPFRNSPLKGRTQLMRYMLSVCGSYAINLVVFKSLVDLLEIYPTPAFVISTLIVVVYSYLMQKYFTFRGCEEG